MELSQRRAMGPLLVSLLLLTINVILPAHGLHFYLDGASSSPKCFYEELPKDTLVVGNFTPNPPLIAKSLLLRLR